MVTCLPCLPFGLWQGCERRGFLSRCLSFYEETGNTAGILYAPEYRFAPLTAESDPSILWFAFSLTEELNDGDAYRLHYENGVSIRVQREEGSFKKFKYNTVIEIKRDSTFLYYLGEK